LLKQAQHQRPEVRDFLERGFRLMALTKFDPRDLSPTVARFFAIFAPSILPTAWGGIVPPLTMPGRHKKIDAYLRSHPWASFEPGTVLLDLGCGFPPQTSMDAADAFPEWQIVGANPSFEPYLLYDERENYTSFDSNGKLRYFQASRPTEFPQLYSDRVPRFGVFRKPSPNYSPICPRTREYSPPPSTTATVCSAILCEPTSALISNSSKEGLDQRPAGSGSRAQLQRAHLL
jgi:hypothetical protein